MPSTIKKTIIKVAITGIVCFGFSTLLLFNHHHNNLEFEHDMLIQITNNVRFLTNESDANISFEDLNLHTASLDYIQSGEQAFVKQVNFIVEEEDSDGETSSTKTLQFKIPFPQTIQNEEFEEINHPAFDMMPPLANSPQGKRLKEKLKVPRFWNPSFFPNSHANDLRESLGNYGERLLTKEETDMIGSFVMPAEDYDEQEEQIVEKEEKRNDDQYVNIIQELSIEVPVDVKPLETIFVAISSYRDPRCTHTVEKLFQQAEYPERLRVAVVDQTSEEDEICIDKKKCDDDNDKVSSPICDFIHQIDTFHLDAELAIGPIFARHIANRMYRGEYFAMQTDAHMEFAIGWDEDLIRQWKSAKNEMAVLTTYVSEVDGHYDKTSGEKIKNSRPKMCNTDFNEDNKSFILEHGQQPESDPDVIGEPTLQPLWAAGFSFARGHFVVQCPYDPYLPWIFQGEEISIGLRGFTYGYDYYAPERSVIFHYYSQGGKRKVHKFWEHRPMYKGVAALSEARLVALTFGNEIINNQEWNNLEARKYGLGNVRTVQKFLDTFGINMKERTTQKHMCKFVGQPMNSIFTPHIREDSMGIDYDKISFKFQDPDIYGKTWETYSNGQPEDNLVQSVV